MSEQQNSRIRNHFTWIFEEMWSMMLAIAAIFMGNVQSIKAAKELFLQGDILQGILKICGGLLILLLIMAWYINRWYKTTFQLKDGTLIIERRTLNRYMNAIAVQNISNINLEQNLFEMLVGTYKLKLDTNTMSTADKTDVKIVLKKKKAYALKNEIMEMMKEIQQKQDRINGIEPEAENAPIQDNADVMESVQEDRYDIIYTMREIVKNCLVNTSVLLVIAAVCFFISAIISVVTALHDGKSFAAVIGVVFAQIILSGSFFTALVNNWLADFNFRAKRTTDKIYVSSGLLKIKKYAVPVNKINAVCINATVLGRIFKRASVKVTNVGGEGQDVDGMKILLADPYAVVQQRMQTLLPEFCFPETKKMEKQPAIVLVKKMIWIAIWGALLTGAVIAFSFGVKAAKRKIVLLAGLAVVAVIVLVAVVGAILKFRITGFRMEEQCLVISIGMFSQLVRYIPYDQIQYLEFKSGPIERLFKMQHAEVSILASSMSRTSLIPSFKVTQFAELEEHFRKTY